MDPSTINWLAVVAATLLFYAIGAVWYSFLFKNAWMKEVKISPDDAKKVSLAKIMSVTFILSFIMVTNLAFFINGPGIDAGKGAFYGFLTGFGWVAMAMTLNAMYEMRGWRYMLINAGYMVVGFTTSGLILGAWK
jgi:hypothetical protein